MDHHKRAWEHVQKHLFGSVCELTTKQNWGFKQDRQDIETISVNGFMPMDGFWGTIILHILHGEGTKMDMVLHALEWAYGRCCKMVILEHNPRYWNIPSTGYIRDWIYTMEPSSVIHEEWDERNELWALSTMDPLVLPELTDEYWADYKDGSFVGEHDKGIDKEHLIYVRTSEKKGAMDVPRDIPTIAVIGGGWSLEHTWDGHVTFIDSTLAQCVWAAYQLAPEPQMHKYRHLYPWLRDITREELWEEQFGNLRHWRRCGIKLPDNFEIRHMSLSDIPDDMPTRVIYVSTIAKIHWEQFIGKHYIIESYTQRDVPKLWRPE